MYVWLQDSFRFGIDAMVAKLTWTNAAALGLVFGLLVAYELFRAIFMGHRATDKSKD